MTMWLIVSVAAFVTSLCLTPVVRTIALRRGLVDVPNERSSHVRPTPRTGGYAIVTGIALALVISGGWRDRWTLATAVAVALLIAMAIVDERRSLPRKGRLVVQLAVVAGLVLWAPLHVPLVPFAVSVGMAVVWIVWSLNAYNFMDGLNGISSATAIVTGASLGWIALRNGDEAAACFAFAAAAAPAGFLPYNLPSGSVFMGDTGSATLGFVFGVLVLRLSSDLASLVACVLPLAPFFLDASVTIVRRMLRGERFFSTPHRSHFYQRLHQKGWSHAQVTGVYTALALVGAVLAVLFSSLSTLVATIATVGFVALHAIVFACIEVAWRRSRSAPG